LDYFPKNRENSTNSQKVGGVCPAVGNAARTEIGSGPPLGAGNSLMDKPRGRRYYIKIRAQMRSFAEKLNNLLKRS
jgi:hypothetical protein